MESVAKKKKINKGLERRMIGSVGARNCSLEMCHTW